METGTEIELSSTFDLVELIQRHAPACETPEQDAERIFRLVKAQELMRIEHLNYTQALESVGLTRSQVHNWKSRKPWVHELATAIGQQQIDHELTSLLLSSRVAIMNRLIDTALFASKAADRATATRLLNELGYKALDASVQEVERTSAKMGEGVGQRRVPTATAYSPIFQQVNVYSTPDGRMFPVAPTIQGEIVDEEE